MTLPEKYAKILEAEAEQYAWPIQPVSSEAAQILIEAYIAGASKYLELLLEARETLDFITHRSQTAISMAVRADKSLTKIDAILERK